MRLPLGVFRKDASLQLSGMSASWISRYLDDALKVVVPTNLDADQSRER
jgi:hypothetical protein